jgi:hypothetical protein
MASSLCQLGPGQTRRGTREDARAVRADAFGPKSENGMGARRRLRTAFSVWVAPLGRVFCPSGRVWTRDDCLRWPAGHALMEPRAMPSKEKKIT